MREKDQDGKHPFVNWIANVVENTEKDYLIAVTTAKAGLSWMEDLLRGNLEAGCGQVSLEYSSTQAVGRGPVSRMVAS